MKVIESFVQTNERLQAQEIYQAPHVATLMAIESSIQTSKRIQVQATYLSSPHNNNASY
jgi:hypothetical protein